MRRMQSRTIGECPCEYALRYIGGAWKILIIVILDRAKIRRYTELRLCCGELLPRCWHNSFARWRAMD